MFSTIFYNIHYYSSSTEQFKIMVTATLRKNRGPPIPKPSGVRPGAVGNMHFFVTQQIDVINKNS